MPHEKLGVEEDPEGFGLDPSQPRTVSISINGVDYPCRDWETIESARVLERRYDVGFNGGVGFFSEGLITRRNQIYAAINLDVSTYPYARLLPLRTKTALGDTSGAVPSYAFVAEDSGGAEYVYIFEGQHAKKIALADDMLQSTKDFGAGAVAGRPVLFEGSWRVPLGDTVQWVTLATVAVGAAADTWDTAETGGSPVGSRMATHFGTLNLEGVAQLWRAHNNDTDAAPGAGVESCRVSGSADAITFGASFEVGDTSLPITDLTSIGGLLYIAKPDTPWLFSEDGGGNAYPVLDFVGKSSFLSGYTGEDGANSGSVGPFYFWTHSSGLWRIFGDMARPVDPISNPDFSGRNFDSTGAAGPVPGMTSAFYGRWLSVASWGQWVYATEATSGLWAGLLLEDGSVHWMSNLFGAQGTSLLALNRCFIVPTSSAPILYVLDQNNDLYRIDLQEDGSLRRVTASGTNHGGDDEVSLLVMPETNFGEPETTKQLRMMWMNFDDFPASGLAVRAVVYRDRSKTPTQVGSDRTSGDGRTEHATTPGTDDEFIDLHPAVEFDTGTFAEATEDPRLRSFGLRAVTPTVYRALIPVSHDEMRGRNASIRGALTKLRNLKSGQSVPVKEPGASTTFTGYIEQVQEAMVAPQGGQKLEYEFAVTIRRWVI